MVSLYDLKQAEESYKNLCYTAIKELLQGGSITFDSSDVENCPYCIGDNYLGIVDGIIKKVFIQNNEIFITYVDNKDDAIEGTEQLKFLIHCDLIDLYTNIQNKIKNG